MEFQEVVRRRRMVRNFSDEDVSSAAIERLLSNATRAPSAGFTQGSAFLVLHGPQETAAFWEVAWPSAEREGSSRTDVMRAPVVIVPLASKDAYLDRYAEGDKGWTDRSESRWPAPYWDIDAGFAALLVLLTAIDEGLGALFFSIRRVEEFRAAFGVPESYRPIGAIAVGHPAADKPSSSLGRGRRPLSDVVHWGRW